MSAATARIHDDGQDVEAAIAAARETTAPDDGQEKMLIKEVQLGFEQLRQMSHDDLRQVITRRVDLLDNVLRERDDRRAAIATAKLAARMLEIRRDRALRIKKRVDTVSAVAALACTVLIFVTMI